MTHNDGAINVLSIVTDDALESVKQHEFFSGQNLYCKLIPKLQADTRDMVHAVDCLIRAAGNDMASGLPGNALAEWCDKDQVRAGELLALVNEGNSAARTFIPLSLRNAAPEVRADLIEHLHAAANAGDDPLRCNAIFGLGQVDPVTDDEWTSLLR